MNNTWKKKHRKEIAISTGSSGTWWVALRDDVIIVRRAETSDGLRGDYHPADCEEVHARVTLLYRRAETCCWALAGERGLKITSPYPVLLTIHPLSVTCAYIDGRRRCERALGPRSVVSIATEFKLLQRPRPSKWVSCKKKCLHTKAYSVRVTLLHTTHASADAEEKKDVGNVWESDP